MFDSNARVRVQASGNAYYPDVSVVCGSAATDPEDGLSLLNPAVLVEVFSPSTVDYDRTEKLADCQQIQSVQHIVHIAHDAQRIDLWSRDEGSWKHSSFGPNQEALLPEVGCTLDVHAIYRDPLVSD